MFMVRFNVISQSAVPSLQRAEKPQNKTNKEKKNNENDEMSVIMAF